MIISKKFILSFFLGCLFLVNSLCNHTSKFTKETSMADQNWREKLTEDQYKVTRMCGTEPPFSGKYYKHNKKGTYNCVCCNTELFSSSTKYDSGSGWPSFYDAINDTSIIQSKDQSMGMVRIEIKCASCESHLGHIFPDGPKPTGNRYCVNSLSLDFKAGK